MKFIDKDLKAVQEARVLMEEAAEAKKTLALFEQKKLAPDRSLHDGCFRA